MTEVISVRFRNRGKFYYFSPEGKQIKKGQQVIVETGKGIEIADCCQANHEVDDDKVVQPLRPVIRIATKDDLRVAEINKQREKEAFGICKKKIAEHGLDMKLVDVECNFEGNKTTFFFTSDGRVDFRELVKDLAAIFRNRIELRQIGVRDEAKMLGGLGICGRPLCCSQFIDEFMPVSTKMAKVQSMSLNPGKISGCCGRLMCCLRYEEEAYEELNKTMPKQGAFVQTPDGYGSVTQINLLRQMVKVKLDGDGDDTLKTYRSVEVATVPGGRPKDGQTPPDVLKYVPPEPDEQEEEEDEWQIPELLVEQPKDEQHGDHASDKRRQQNGRRRQRGRGNKPKAEQSAADKDNKKPAKRENVKPKPKNAAKPAQEQGAQPSQQPKQKKPYRKPYRPRKPKNGGGKRADEGSHGGSDS